MDRLAQGPERRKAKRASLIVDLFYKVERPPELTMKIGGRLETAYLMDVSEGGIGFISAAKLPQNAELDILFNLISEEARNPKIRALGIVQYCSPRPDFQTYRIGIKFIRIGRGERRLIARYKVI